MTVRATLGRVPGARALRASARALLAPGGLSPSGLLAWKRFAADYRAYRELVGTSPTWRLSPLDLYPCLRDRTTETPLEPTYFFQDTWFAGRLAGVRPAAHVDVGSSAKTMALVAQFVPVTMVDIRPVGLPAPGFRFVEGTILALPFRDGSVSSLSSLCVVEHVGLGRYGDPLDAAGSEKAIAELLRVLAPGGDLYLSLPVDTHSKVYFNAHRAFTRNHVYDLLGHVEVCDEQYVYGTSLSPHYDPAAGFGTGLYHVRKT